jgi:fibronectin type 3 domain-containing protein
VQDAEGYHVYRWDNTPQEWVRIGSSVNEGYQDAKIPAGSSSQRYIVSAYAGDTESKAGPGIAVAIPPAQKAPEPPVPPASVKASQGTFRDKIDVTWDRVPEAESYILRKWSDKTSGWAELGRTRGLSYTDTRVPEKKALYSVVTVRGALTSESSVIAEGWLSTAPKKQSPVKFDDDKYREEFFTREEKFFGDEKFFSDDKFFTGESAFFNNFDEENFFFFDEEAFFHVDEKFFDTTEDDFFGGESGKGFFD